jgi:hypothetical protein
LSFGIQAQSIHQPKAQIQRALQSYNNGDPVKKTVAAEFQMSVGSGKGGNGNALVQLPGSSNQSRKSSLNSTKQNKVK